MNAGIRKKVKPRIGCLNEYTLVSSQKSNIMYLTKLNLTKCKLKEMYHVNLRRNSRHRVRGYHPQK